LLKKFYLSPQTNSPFAKEISIFLDREDFILLEQKIKYDPDIRKTLISNYIDNAKLSNHHLAVNKAWNSDYDDVHRVLSSLNNFYLHRDINPTPQLKKSFYN